MFRKNTSHLQPSLFGIASQLPQAKLKKLKKSKEYEFYRLVFSQIKEEDFAVLYSDRSSRPNAGVNSLVASIILMYHNNWTTQELFNRIDFDLLTRTALGLDTLEETPFCPATFFNFQNRLLWHFSQTGNNLLEWVFDNLTHQQLKTLKIKTNIQRSDSFMAMSNIRSYSRTQLLIEMLIRLYRILSDKDKVQVKPSKELKGNILQSPDDIDATYRKKRDRHCRGQSVDVTETANPENDLNLITDVSVCSNDTDDSRILNERLEHIKDKTPDLEELHTDGADGSEGNDKKMEKLEITHVQTAVRGRKAEVSMEIEETADGQYSVKCPHQCVISEKARKRYKACFDVKICKQCSLSKCCPAKEQSNKRTYYFARSDYLVGKRNRNIKSLPPERRRLRPNVEATIKEFTKPLNHKGKLKVRGLFKTMVYAHAMALSINFGRVWRYIAENPDFFGLLNLLCAVLRCLFAKHSRNKLGEVVIRERSCCWAEPRQYFRQAA